MGLLLHVAHLPVNTFNLIVVDEEIRNHTVPWRVRGERRLEDRRKFQKVFSERDGDLNGVGGLSRPCRDLCAWKLSHGGHRLIHIFAVTPSQVTAPVQLEALAVAVRGTDGQPVARLEVRSTGGAAPRQGLRLVHFLALPAALGRRGRTHLCR